nr:hypothetical protein [Mangrovibacterium marinum]
MADVHNKPTRSYNMSRIRGKDTKPELLESSYYCSEFQEEALNNISSRFDICLNL